MDQLTLGKIMMKVNNLPVLPHVTNRVLELTNNPKSSPQEICEVICQDQVLASKVLKLVNSVYYGLPRKVATVTEAITILGMQTLRTVVVGASVYKTLNDVRTRRATNPDLIWRHAAVCAVSAKTLAAKLGVLQKEHAFIAGLLHDIGKLILNSFMHEEYGRVLNLLAKGYSVVEAEQQVLSTTHAEIGGFVAEKWNLPVVLVQPIRYHHDPLYPCQNSELVQVVYLADIISVIAGYSATGTLDFSLDGKVLKKCGLTYEQLYTLADEIKGSMCIDFL